MIFLERFSGFVLMVISVFYFRRVYYQPIKSGVSYRGRGYIAAIIFFSLGLLTIFGKFHLFEFICGIFEKIADKFSN